MRHIVAGNAVSIIGLLSVLSLSSFAVPVLASQAPPVPDAGSIFRDQKSMLPQFPQLPAREKARELPAKSESGVLVAVKGFKFSGYEGAVTEAELQALGADIKGKSISFEELKALADKITAYFREKGWFRARAYLPKQDVTSGIIEIAVLQGASDGRLEFKLDKTARISQGVLHSIGETAIRKGAPVNEHDLERSVLIMNDLPGVIARASLAPGTLPGTTGVEVAVSEGPILSGLIWGDNYGNRYTGSWRGNTMISINDPFCYGDQITALMNEADGLVQGRIGYSAPVFLPGLRGSLSYTGMSYEIGADRAYLAATGSSNNVDAGLSYSLIRSRTRNLTTSMTYGYKSLVDRTAGPAYYEKQLNSVTLNVNSDRYDQLWGGGASSYSIGVTTGHLNESKNASYYLTGKEGQYTRFNFALARLQRLSEEVNFNLSGVAQMSLDNLGSSEQFSLGGPNAVRAYPVGEAPGDEGQLITADIRYNIPLATSTRSIQIDGFYDAGHITLNRDRYAGDVFNDTSRNTYWLQGAGVGLNFLFSQKGALQCSWAHVIGSNPGQYQGKNADGRAENSRFWLHGELYF
ncbi:MAG: ShlB/FhaC/HecB family hemolysin secretion/activation protein [Chlorobiaceae bacterium]